MKGFPRPPATWRARLAALRGQRWARWALDLGILLLAVTAVGAWQTRRHVASGAALPALVLRTLDGATVDLSGLRGRPTAVALWAPWCSICKLESPNLSWLQRLAGDRFRVISVAAAYDATDEVRRYVSEQQVDYPVLLGDDAAVRALRVEAFPTVYFLDAEGRVKGSVTGYTTTLGLLVRLLL